METLIALILSIILMFSAASQPSNISAANSAAATTQSTLIRSVPSSMGRVLGEADSNYTIVRTLSVLGTEWTCIRCNGATGWVTTEQLNKLVPPKPVEEVIPSWAKWCIINNDYLNIRSAAGVNNDIVGTYHYGDRVALLQIADDWGKTTKGWISLNYVYMEGTKGEHTMDGVVTASQLNIRKGPGTEYPSVGCLYKGDKIEILEQFRFGSTVWGCTKYGWVCMSYVEEEQKEPIIGYGIVVVDALDVYSAKSGHKVVETLKKGDIVPVFEIVKEHHKFWARTAKGWISMDGIVIDTEPVCPTEPTKPTEVPVETEPATTPEETVPTETEAPTEGSHSRPNRHWGRE